jgi:CRISPR-associated protein Cas2
MFWVVSYDIVDDRRRGRVSKVLEGYGRRVQYSVFECDLDDDEKRKTLEKRLLREINDKEDDIRFYPLDQGGLKRVRLLGKARLERKRGYYLV